MATHVRGLNQFRPAPWVLLVATLAASGCSDSTTASDSRADVAGQQRAPGGAPELELPESGSATEWCQNVLQTAGASEVHGFDTQADHGYSLSKVEGSSFGSEVGSAVICGGYSPIIITIEIIRDEEAAERNLDDLSDELREALDPSHGDGASTQDSLRGIPVTRFTDAGVQVVRASAGGRTVDLRDIAGEDVPATEFDDMAGRIIELALTSAIPLDSEE